MAGLLGGIYSAGDTLKRRLRGLLDDPVGTIGLGVERFGEDQRGLLNLMANAYPMAGDRTVLNSPEQIDRMRSEFADKATEQALAGMFVGPGAKVWDAVSANKAKELESAGTSPRQIWSDTGTWKGPDGAWRQEIPDNAAKFKEEPRENIANRMPLGRAVKHDALFDAYPETWDTKVQFTNGPGGSFKSNGLIEVGTQDAPYPIGVTSHELQHAIQQREGWAKGGSPDSMNITMHTMPKHIQNEYRSRIDVLPDDATEAQVKSISKEFYKRLAGEAEARATQARISLDAAQRRALFPEDSYDVPLDQLIMRGMSGQ